MSARAVVTRYNNEHVLANGNFSVDAIVLITDPAHQGDGSGLGALATDAPGIELDASTPATWSATIENAVIAKGIELGYTDLVAATTFIPTIA
jgi:hypothetical protein